MNRAPLTFLVVGFAGGLASVALGSIWPTILISGVGLVFFGTLLVAIAVSASWSRLKGDTWRYLAGVVISTAAYLLGLLAFSGAGGYAPDLFGVRASPDISHFGPDVAIGLSTAALVSSICVEVLTWVLTGRWSNRFLMLLAIAGLATVAATYAGHLFSRQPWAFFGVLLPVGEALFCWIVGLQIYQSDEAAHPTTVVS